MLKRLRSFGPTVILSDGDVVFQPRKVEHAGLSDAVDGRVLIYIHKEEALDDVERRYPAEHYVLVDDKLRILTAVKQVWGERVTTVFPRQGSYAHDPQVIGALPPADVTIERIGDLLDYDLPRLRTAPRPPCIQPEGDAMKPTKKLHDLGQSLWLDNITRELLNSGTLQRYIDELSVTGLTSNPTIFDHAIKNSTTYDADIARKASVGEIGRGPVLRTGAGGPDPGRRSVPARLRPDRRRRRLGVARGLAASGPRHQQHAGGRARSAPARRQAQPLHQDSRHAGRTARHRGGDLRRRSGQRHAAVLARAICRGGRSLSARRRAAHRGGAEPGRRLGRLAVRQPLGCRGQPARCRPSSTNRLGIAIAQRAYKAYRELLASPRFQRAANAGARAQRLLWASTGTKDPKASDILYVKALAAPFTVNTMPEGTLKAFADHGEVGATLAPDGGDCETVLASFAKAGIDIDALAARLQDEGAASFVKSWNDLMACIDSKSTAMRKAS